MKKKVFVLVLLSMVFVVKASEQSKWVTPFRQQPQQAGQAMWEHSSVAHTFEQSLVSVEVSEDKVTCGSYEAIQDALNPATGENFVKTTHIASNLAGNQFTFDRFFKTLCLAISKHNEALTGSLQEKELNKVHLISILQALVPNNDMNAARLFHQLKPEHLK